MAVIKLDNFREDYLGSLSASGSRQRYECDVLVVSEQFYFGDDDKHFIEHANYPLGRTILKSAGVPMPELVPKRFYKINNCLISQYSGIKVTTAMFQIEVDEESTIEPLDIDEPPRFDISNLSDIDIGPITYPIGGTYMGLAIIPLVDLRDTIEPRRIVCIDKSGREIVWALYDADFEDDEAIDGIMRRPLIIRSAWVYYFHKFGELQFKANLCCAYLEDEVGDEPGIQEVQQYADTVINTNDFKSDR